MKKHTPISIKYNMRHIIYDKLSNDTKYLLDTLVDDVGLATEQTLCISNKKTKSMKRLHLESLICNYPNYSAEEIYILCLAHWIYPCIEANDIVNGKKGKLVECIPEYNLCIYKIGKDETFKYILIHKKNDNILGYINLSIENNTATILNVYGGNLGCGWNSLKIFLEKWFIPKYGVIIKDNDLPKLLK